MLSVAATHDAQCSASRPSVPAKTVGAPALQAAAPSQGVEGAQQAGAGRVAAGDRHRSRLDAGFSKCWHPHGAVRLCPASSASTGAQGGVNTPSGASMSIVRLAALGGLAGALLCVRPRRGPTPASTAASAAPMRVPWEGIARIAATLFGMGTRVSTTDGG